jgi:transposase
MSSIYVDRVPNQYSKEACVLIRESTYVNGKVVKRTLANISFLSPELIDIISKSLRGERFVQESVLTESIDIQNTIPSGHVNAVKLTMERLGMAKLIDPKASPEKDLILGLIAARILEPESKLATSTWWKTNTLASEFGIEDADENDIYRAMDWLLSRQSAIENRLAQRHVKSGDLLFLDMSSSYYEGTKSQLVGEGANKDEAAGEEESNLARFGYSRDKKRGKTQINYGLLADDQGRPISINVYPGNTSDCKIAWPIAQKIMDTFELEKFVLVGDRGMITGENIKLFKETGGIDWISVLKSVSIKSLIDEIINNSLFDEMNLCEFMAPNEFPNERLIACRNPSLAIKRAKTRDELLSKTILALEKIKTRVIAGRLKGKDKIGLTVGKAIQKNKMGKHIIFDIKDTDFDYHINETSVKNEQALDGVYVIRTSLPKEVMSSEECVRQYKNLANVERAFRTMKTVSLRVRPIYHRLDDRIRAHFFLTMLAYYVEWHMREAWRELMFSDPDINFKKDRDPVAPAKRSAKGDKKASCKKNEDGFGVQKFKMVLAKLAGISEVTYTISPKLTGGESVSFRGGPRLTPFQTKAYELIRKIKL